MGRTYKDMPLRVLECMPSQRWRFNVGWPAAMDRAWCGLSQRANRENRSQRRYVKRELQELREPHPWRKWPQDVKWIIW